MQLSLPLVSLILLLVVGFADAAGLDTLPAQDAQPASGRTLRVVLVGDSTVTDTAGWGRGFKQFVNERVVCVNTAVGGRSSMSYIKEGRWEKALALRGNYYLIQFGHNDQPGKPGRSTDAETEYRAYLSLYVDEARQIGATPVLVTSLVRREFDKSNPHKINSSLELYVEVVQEIAAQKNVPLVDLHARSKDLCESLGKEACLEFSPFTVSTGKTNYDGTHLNAHGGVIFARLVVDELRQVVPELAGCLRSEPGPVARPRVFNVNDYGAKGDGKTLDTLAIQRVFDACGQAGGGVVRLAPGTYLSAPIFMRGNTTLRLDAGATLQANDDLEVYANPAQPASRLGLVNAEGLNAVAITGNGVIDGSGKHWWRSIRDTPEPGQLASCARPYLVGFSNCVDVKLEDVTLQNSPSSHFVPVDCENVSISGMVIQAPRDAPHTDAIHLNACRYVTIHDCLLDVGGSNIAVTSGHEDIAHPNAASEHVTIGDCGFLGGNGISIGSDTLGGVRNITVSNCTFNGTTSGIRIESARGRGGVVENVDYHNLKMTDVDWPVYLSSCDPTMPDEYAAQPRSATTPTCRSIWIQNVTGSGSGAAGTIMGLPECTISNVVFDEVHLTAPKGMTIRNAEAYSSTIRPSRSKPVRR